MSIRISPLSGSSAIPASPRSQTSNSVQGIVTGPTWSRLCRENGISHRLTAVRAPTTTGKIERFHQSLRKEFLADRSFRSMAVAQDALDEWVNDYTPRTTPGARDGHSGRSFSIAACESDGTLVPTESAASSTVSRAGSANCRRFPSLRSAQSSGGGLLLHDRHGDDPASGNRSGWLSGMIRCRPPSRSSPVKGSIRAHHRRTPWGIYQGSGRVP
jgi:hypothetical protein